MALLVLLIPRLLANQHDRRASDAFAEHGLRAFAYNGQPWQACTARRNVRNEREAGTNGPAVQVVSIAGMAVMADAETGRVAPPRSTSSRDFDDPRWPLLNPIRVPYPHGAVLMRCGRARWRVDLRPLASTPRSGRHRCGANDPAFRDTRSWTDGRVGLAFGAARRPYVPFAPIPEPIDISLGWRPSG